MHKILDFLRQSLLFFHAEGTITNTGRVRNVIFSLHSWCISPEARIKALEFLKIPYRITTTDIAIKIQGSKMICIIMVLCLSAMRSPECIKLLICLMNIRQRKLQIMTRYSICFLEQWHRIIFVSMQHRLWRIIDNDIIYMQLVQRLLQRIGLQDRTKINKINIMIVADNPVFFHDTSPYPYINIPSIKIYGFAFLDCTVQGHAPSSSSHLASNAHYSPLLQCNARIQPTHSEDLLLGIYRNTSYSY